ncbi:DNA polymerase III subunit beta [Candidatus Gottesmanbacteria bacterium]|nr:DNA polymerase III subunit beta [Candidatus Gottesmanbacteria bacterium]
MNIQILQENLLRALIKTGRIISSKPQLPILQSLLLTTREGQLTIIASSLEATEIVTTRGKITKEGGMCVPSRLLIEFISSLPQETVTLEAKEGALSVACGKIHATIPGTLVSEFPTVPSRGKGSSFSFDKDSFVLALQGVLFAAATDESRPLLTGVKIIGGKDGMSLTATDGYRLSQKNLRGGANFSSTVVIPSRALSEVVKLCQEDKEVKELFFEETKEGQLVFSVGDTNLFTRRIDGEYPNTEKIIPKTYTTKITLDKEQFGRAVKSASVFARDNANIIRFHIEGNLLTVSANTPSVGENTIEVDGKAEGDGGDIAFNSRFLTEFLSNTKGDELVFEMTGSLNPGVFRVVGDDSFFHIIMPVRVQN